MTPPVAHPPSANSPPRAVVLTGVVLLALLLAAAVVDRMFVSNIQRTARDDAMRVLRGHADAIELAVAEYGVLVEGLAAWTEEFPDADGDAYAAYAAILASTSPETLALNRIRGTIIEDVFPAEPNRAARGIDLETHTEPASYEGLLRARRSGGVSLSEPFPLAQGGVGVVLFRTGGVGADGRQLAAQVVVSLDALLDGTGIERLAEDYRIHMTAASGATVRGADLDPRDAPESVGVDLPEGVWRLEAVPAAGWGALSGSAIPAFRASLLAIVSLLGVLTWGLASRDTRLTRAVAERTRALERANADLEAQRQLRDAAMSAGGVDVWAWDVATDELERAGDLQATLGQPPREPLESFLARVHPADVDALRERIHEARESGEISTEFRERRPDGSWMWLRVEGRAVESSGGQALRLLGAGADISAVKKLEAELVHSGRVELIGQLAGGIVHDINNALMVVLVELDFAEEDGAIAELEEARSAARYASVLTSQMLAFARKDEAHPTALVWDDLCRETATFIDRVLGGGIVLESDLGAGEAQVRLDRTQAMQILVNLATNARDAMKARGTLGLRTRVVEDGAAVTAEGPPGPAVVTEISDTGGGIPEEIRSEIFDAFFTTKGREAGTGLGLAITRRLVREAGGDIHFRTSSEGTTFTIVLPMQSPS